MLLINENNYRVVLCQERLTCTGFTVKHFWFLLTGTVSFEGRC